MTRLPRPLAVLALVAAFALAVPAQGAAATPTDRKVAQLQKQVKTLQKQVKTLQTQMRLALGLAVINFAADTCHAAIVADTFQGTWTAIDAREQATPGGQPIFGAQTPVNDYGNCAFLEQPAVPRPGIQNPPSIAAFNPLLAWLHVEE
jgi:hypothetical protein